MKYSDAFLGLHKMSLDIDLTETIQHKRVAGYLTIVREMPHPSLLPPKWRKRFDEHRDVALGHFVNLTDSEWEEIREAMVSYVNRDKPSQWKTKRNNWVLALDTLRAFH